MKNVQFQATLDSVRVDYVNNNGKPSREFVSKSEKSEKYDTILDYIRNNDEDGLVAFLEKDQVTIEKAYESRFRFENGHVMVGDDCLPELLGKRLLEYAKQNLPVDSLLNFWEKLKQNPSRKAVHQLFGCLERNHHSFFEDGDFLAYKGVDSDFKDRHSRSFDNSPGVVNKMARNAVDDDNVNSCSYGFHVGSYDYAKSFGPTLIRVKVNPANVVAVPTDANWQKMRVCEYEVLDVCERFYNEQIVGDSKDEEDDFEDDYEDDDVDEEYDDEDVVYNTW